MVDYTRKECLLLSGRKALVMPGLHAQCSIFIVRFTLLVEVDYGKVACAHHASPTTCNG